MPALQDQFDVVIIGSGAGGAPVAHTLARQGKSVCIIEKGPLFRPQADDPMGLSDYKRDELISDGPEKKLTVPGLANTGASFYTSHVEPDLNDEPHVYRNNNSQDYATIEGYTCQCVGGGTQHYGGVSLRFSQLDFELERFNADRKDTQADFTDAVRRELRNWPVPYKEFEPYYSKAEKLIGINGSRQDQIKLASEDNYQKPLPPNPISEYAKVGMLALGMKPYRTPQAVITEDHAPSGRQVGPVRDTGWAGGPKTAYVNRYGDPLDYKSTTWVALLRQLCPAPQSASTRLPDGKAVPITLRPNCNVTHLACEGDRISKVHYRDPSGRQQTVSGKIVVVACSAIESVRLLKLSAAQDAEFDKRINHNDLLGKYFLTHCFGGASAVMPTRFDKSLSVDSDWATDFCGTEDFIRSKGLWAGGTIYNNTSDEALPVALGRTHGAADLDTLWHGFDNDTSIVGERFRAFLNDQFNRRLSVSFMANQLPQKTNRIELHPTVRDKWGRNVAYIIKEWHPHDRYLMDTLANMCRDILAYGGDGGKGQFHVEGSGGVYQSENSLARVANHILGGARFGADERDSVLNVNCQAWRIENLYVTDGSFMPTSGSGNPTLTIQANAFRVADTLLRDGKV
jgi:choline dehydrogenase-like flavoprotein